MHVTFLSASGGLGGAERVLLDCLAAGRTAGDVEMSLVTLEPGPLADASRALGARVEVVTAPDAVVSLGDAYGSRRVLASALLPAAAALPGFVRRVARVLAALGPDVVHSHGIKTHVLGALVPRRARLIWHLHDHLGGRSVSSRLLALLATRCDVALAVSESVAADARSHLPARLPVVVAHNAVDGDRFQPEGARLDLDALAGLSPAPDGTTRIGLPATFARWKGHDVFIEALARLNRPDVRGYIIGAPLYRTARSQWSRGELEGRVRDAGLDGRIGFTGAVEDMPAAYRALDVVVHASTRPEPFGLVIVEAMACGRPLVAVPRGGAAELFVDGEHAVGVPPSDAGALAGALARLLGDPARATDMGRRARLRALAHHGPDRFGAQIRSAWSVPVSSSGRRRAA